MLKVNYKSNLVACFTLDGVRYVALMRNCGEALNVHIEETFNENPRLDRPVIKTPVDRRYFIGDQDIELAVLQLRSAKAQVIRLQQNQKEFALPCAA